MYRRTEKNIFVEFYNSLPRFLLVNLSYALISGECSTNLSPFSWVTLQHHKYISQMCRINFNGKYAIIYSNWWRSWAASAGFQEKTFLVPPFLIFVLTTKSTRRNGKERTGLSDPYQFSFVWKEEYAIFYSRITISSSLNAILRNSESDEWKGVETFIWKAALHVLCMIVVKEMHLLDSFILCL